MGFLAADADQSRPFPLDGQMDARTAADARFRSMDRPPARLESPSTGSLIGSGRAAGAALTGGVFLSPAAGNSRNHHYPNVRASQRVADGDRDSGDCIAFSVGGRLGILQTPSRHERSAGRGRKRQSFVSDNASNRLNWSSVTGITDSRDCFTSTISFKILSALICESVTGFIRALTGTRSTAAQSSSPAVGSG